MKNRILVAIFAVLLISMAACSCQGGRQDSRSSEYSCSDTLDGALLYGIPVDDYTVIDFEVESGDNLSTILDRLGVPAQDINAVAQKSNGVFDIRNIRLGNDCHALLSGIGDSLTLSYLIYEKDRTSAVIYGFKDSLTVTTSSKELVEELKYAQVTISTSLWNDVIDSGFTPLLAVKLSDIYAWTIDFFSLQKGDSFKALFNEVSCDGKTMDVGEVLYVDFIHQGKSYPCYYFEQENSSNHYWNEDGESMRKSFLKAPLQFFSRISSKFSYARRHPITRIVRPHTGVDYAAPKGTPVLSIGDGTVIEKGYKGGGGNTVKIRHNSVYTTAYLHLSRYGSGIKVGSHVSQGQVIGYVGSTGASTGPHLDFRVWKNGTPIDPLKMDSPPAEPVAKEYRKAFEAQKEQSRLLASNTFYFEMFKRYYIEPLTFYL